MITWKLDMFSIRNVLRPFCVWTKKSSADVPYLAKHWLPVINILTNKRLKHFNLNINLSRLYLLGQWRLDCEKNQQFRMWWEDLPRFCLPICRKLILNRNQLVNNIPHVFRRHIFPIDHMTWCCSRVCSSDISERCRSTPGPLRDNKIKIFF